MKYFTRKSNIDRVFRIELSYQLRNWMQQNGISAIDLATKAGVTKNTVYKAIHNRPIYEESLIKIADYLHLSIDNLIVPPYKSDSFMCLLQFHHNLQLIPCKLTRLQVQRRYINKLNRIYPKYEINRNSAWISYMEKNKSQIRNNLSKKN